MIRPRIIDPKRRRTLRKSIKLGFKLLKNKELLVPGRGAEISVNLLILKAFVAGRRQVPPKLPQLGARFAWTLVDNGSSRVSVTLVKHSALVARVPLHTLGLREGTFGFPVTFGHRRYGVNGVVPEAATRRRFGWHAICRQDSLRPGTDACPQLGSGHGRRRPAGRPCRSSARGSFQSQYRDLCGGNWRGP